MIKNNPIYSKRVFIRSIITSTLLLIGLFPSHFIEDKQTLGIACLRWTVLVSIFIVCFVSIYWQKKW